MDKVDEVGAATLAVSGGYFLASITTIKLMNLRGRKFLIQLGTAICCVSLGVLAMAFMIKGTKNYEESKVETMVIVASMCIFMVFFGITLGPLTSLYVLEIVEPKIMPYATMTNLLGATANILIFPLIPKGS